MADKSVYNKIIEELNKNSSVFENLLKNTDKEEYLWRPGSEKWCLLEIICHLYDEEREDFRARIKHIFDTPSKSLSVFDPRLWVEERKYIQQNYNEMINKFLYERKQSYAGNW